MIAQQSTKLYREEKNITVVHITRNPQPSPLVRVRRGREEQRVRQGLGAAQRRVDRHRHRQAAQPRRSGLLGGSRLDGIPGEESF